MATDSSILVWEIPWTEEPGELQTMRTQESYTTELLNNNVLGVLCGWERKAPCAVLVITDQVMTPYRGTIHILICGMGDRSLRGAVTYPRTLG